MRKKLISLIISCVAYHSWWTKHILSTQHKEGLCADLGSQKLLFFFFFLHKWWKLISTCTTVRIGPGLSMLWCLFQSVNGENWFQHESLRKSISVWASWDSFQSRRAESILVTCKSNSRSPHWKINSRRLHGLISAGVVREFTYCSGLRELISHSTRLRSASQCANFSHWEGLRIFVVRSAIVN